MRPKITVALVLMPLLGALTPGAEARPARPSVVRDSPIIVMLDTGVRATHQEFDYRGPDSSADQMVAWWDFTGDKRQARRAQGWPTVGSARPRAL